MVKEDKAFDPIGVGFFGMDRVMFEANEVADLIEQFFGWGGSRHRNLLDEVEKWFYTGKVRAGRPDRPVNGESGGINRARAGILRPSSI